jgi:hypothetical protein
MGDHADDTGINSPNFVPVLACISIPVLFTVLSLNHVAGRRHANLPFTGQEIFLVTAKFRGFNLA